MQTPLRDYTSPLVSYDAPPRRRWYQRRWLVALLIILLVGSVTALPAWRWWKSWQARRLAATAVAYMGANDLQKALPFIQEADHLAPNDPTILEIKGHFLTRAHAFGPAIAVWERILRGNHPLSHEARLDYATAAYELGRLTAAAEQLRLLHKEVPAGLPAASLLNAKLAERSGDQVAATGAALEVLAFAQSTGAERYDAAAGILANSCDLPPRVQAWKVLDQLAEGNDTVALQALAFMSSQQLNPTVNTEGREGLAADIPALIQRLEQHPLVNPAIRLSVLELRFKQNPSQADVLVAKAIADYKDGDDNALGSLCRWLLSHRGSAQVIELLPLTRVIKSRTLLTLRMEALATASEWGLVEKDLGDPAVSGQLDDVMVPLYLARSATRLGKAVAAEVNWDRAMALAAGDKRKLFIVGTVAESEHQSDRAQAAYEAVVAAAPGEMQGYVTLLRFSAEHGGAAASYKVLTAMTKHWPDDQAILSSQIYAGLLCGEVPLEKARETMERLVREHPSGSAYRSALGLALLRQDDPQGALRDLGEPFNPGAGAGAQAALVVHAAALAAMGQHLQAKQEAAAVTSSRHLLPEETALLQPALETGNGN